MEKPGKDEIMSGILCHRHAHGNVLMTKGPHGKFLRLGGQRTEAASEGSRTKYCADDVAAEQTTTRFRCVKDNMTNNRTICCTGQYESTLNLY